MTVAPVISTIRARTGIFDGRSGPSAMYIINRLVDRKNRKIGKMDCIY